MYLVCTSPSVAARSHNLPAPVLGDAPAPATPARLTRRRRAIDPGCQAGGGKCDCSRHFHLRKQQCGGMSRWLQSRLKAELILKGTLPGYFWVFFCCFWVRPERKEFDESEQTPASSEYVV